MPDGHGGTAGRGRAAIIRACEKHWAQNSGKCNEFVHAVVRDLHLHPFLHKAANDMYDQIHSPLWTPIGTGVRASVNAGMAGAEGNFVIGAWKNTQGHGHVAIVVDFNETVNQAIAYWGVLNSTGQRYGHITASFSLNKLKDTFFAYRELPPHVHRRHVQLA